MIVFFDDACGLCDRTVRWLWARTDAEVRFAPLQGATALTYVPAKWRTPPLRTLVVWEDGAVYIESDGLAAVAHRMLGARGHVATVFTLPLFRPALNIGYRLVARYRHRWFGTACHVPPDPKRLLP